MKWLKKAVAKWAREGNQYEEAESSQYIVGSDVAIKKSHRDRGLYIVSQDRPRTFDASGMSFTLYKSVGGFVLETHRYDAKTDRRLNELYMIDEERDFAQQVAQAIMMESMKL
jgi:hypothetical protein